MVTKQHTWVKKEPFQLKKSTANQRIQQLSLDILPEKPVALSFDGEDVSGNGGLLLAGQAEKATGLLKRASQRLADHRTQSLIRHNNFEQISQRVFQIIAGFSAADDSDFMRKDPALKAATGRNPLTGDDLASQPTQSRFENSRTFKELYKLSAWLIEYYIASHRKPPKKIVLDFDGSAIETSGVQLNAFYRSGPYQKFMYFPLFVFDENGALLVAALRPGDQGEVELALPVLKRLVKMLRKAWPAVQIMMRADGAFTSNELYQWMDNNGVKYALGMKHNNVLLTKSRHCRADAAAKFKRKYDQAQFLGKDGDKKLNKRLKEIRAIPARAVRLQANAEFKSRRARCFGDLVYKAESWDRERRVIARCDYTDAGLEVRYIVTNIQNVVAKLVYEQIYCKRALCESWIKNIKETQCERMSCSQFKANAFRLLLHALAYILIHQIQKCLPERLSVAQFQRRFVNIAVRVHETRTAVHFRISHSYHAAKAFRACTKRLGAPTPVAA